MATPQVSDDNQQTAANKKTTTARCFSILADKVFYFNPKAKNGLRCCLITVCCFLSLDLKIAADGNNARQDAERDAKHEKTSKNREKEL